MYSASWDPACYLLPHSRISVLYSQEFYSPLPPVTLPVFSYIPQYEYLMATLPLLLCVYHICSKLLKLLMYLSQNFLVFQDPVL